MIQTAKKGGEDMTETPLYRKVCRLTDKADKKSHEWSDLHIQMFEALGRAEWEPDKVHWGILRLFEWTYNDWYPPKPRHR